jgi:hypothetical protein
MWRVGKALRGMRGGETGGETGGGGGDIIFDLSQRLDDSDETFRRSLYNIYIIVPIYRYTYMYIYIYIYR